VTSIGNRAFAETPLSSVTIGAGVELGNSAFDGNFESQYISSSYDYNSGRYIYRRIAGTYTKRGNYWSRR